MTVISDIIQQAFRESDLLSELNHPTPTQMSEALARLNTIFKSTLGYEVGEQLRDVNLGKSEIDKNVWTNVEWVDNTPSWWWSNNVSDPNVRLIVQVEEPTDVYLPPRPQDGARFGLHDPFGILSTNPVTIHGNGRLIESADSVVLNTDNVRLQWMFRADLSDWVRIEGLTDASQEMPFPEEFDDYFITELAMKINPRNKALTTQETVRTQARMRSEIRSRYRQNRQMPAELGLWYPAWWGAGRFVTGKI